MALKRGQVTVFIIIGVLIVAAAAVFFLLNKQSRINPLPPYANSVNSFVSECIKDTAIDGVYLAGENGGYFPLSSFSAVGGVPYYHYGGNDYIPSSKKIENSISDYVDTFLDACTDNFSDFTDLNISSGEAKASARMEDGEIILNVNYPVTVRKGNSTYRLENFSNIQLPLRAGTVSKAASDIAHSFDEGKMCLSCIYGIGSKNGLTVDMTSIDEGILFEITDDSSNLKGAPLKWRFIYGY